MIYPNLLKEIKKNKDSQEEIAQLLNVSQMTISNKLRGITEWTIGEVELLCEHYDKDYYYLFEKE